MARPATGKTPKRSVRIDDLRWAAAKAKAERDGKTVSDVLKECIDKYVEDDKR
jgi:hypothetical protein